MKKAALVVLAIVVLVIGAALVLPFVIPTDTYRAQIEAQAERLTGRALSIDGPVELSFLPTVALRAEQVRFANVPDGVEADMVRLRRLQVELEVWPLLTGQVEVERFVLIEPVIHLEVDAEGRPNWQFGDAAGAPGDDVASEPAPDDGATLPVTDLRLDDVRIENGTLTYDDAASGTSERVEGIAMTVSLPGIQSPLEAEGELDYEGRQVDLELWVESPQALVQNGVSKVRLAAAAPDAEIRFDGEARSGPAPGAGGRLELEVASIRDLVAWLAEPLEIEGEGLRTLAIQGSLEAAPERVALTDATVALDDIAGEGTFAVDLGAGAPKASGRLDLGMVDLDPYLPPEAEEEAEAADPEAETEGETGAGAEDAAAPEWSDEPIALPPVGGFDLDVALTVDGMRMQDIELGPSALDIALEGQRFTADLTELTLYGGRGQGSLEVSLEDGVPHLRESFRLEGLQALPFLTAVADLDRIEGVADFELEAETRGVSERDLVQNLNGSGSAMFEDGALVGINVAAMVRNIGSAFLDPSAGEARKTDFAELGGSFTIEDGVLRNDDMRMLAPTLRILGSGRVDLPARTLDYRLEPRAVASIEGQGGETDLSGLLVPVVIEGPWHDLAFRPDLSGVLQSAIEDPEALRQQLEQLGVEGEALRDAVRDLDTGAGAGAVIEQLQQPGGAERLLEEAPVDEETRSLIQGLGAALSGRKSGGDGEPEATTDTGEPAEPAPAPEEESSPAEQLLRGLFRN